MTHGTCRLTAKNRDRLRNPTLGNRVWATFNFFLPFISRFALGRLVAVGGKCRPIRLLSGAVALYAPTVKPPSRTGYLISAHAYAKTPRVIRLLPLPPTPAPSPENSYRGHYSLVCVRVGTAGRCPRWWFLGEVSEEGANAQHALRINRHLQF